MYLTIISLIPALMGQCSAAEVHGLGLKDIGGTPTLCLEAVGSLVTRCLPVSLGGVFLSDSFFFF